MTDTLSHLPKLWAYRHRASGYWESPYLGKSQATTALHRSLRRCRYPFGSRVDAKEQAKAEYELVELTLVPTIPDDAQL